MFMIIPEDEYTLTILHVELGCMVNDPTLFVLFDIAEGKYKNYFDNLSSPAEQDLMYIFEIHGHKAKHFNSFIECLKQSNRGFKYKDELTGICRLCDQRVGAKIIHLPELIRGRVHKKVAIERFFKLADDKINK